MNSSKTQDFIVERKTSLSRAAFWIPTFISVIFIIISGEDVLFDHPMLCDYVIFVSNVAPSLNGWAQHSPTPQITALSLTLAWSIIPYWTIFYLFDRRNRIELERAMRIDGKCLGLFPIFAFVMLAISYFYFNEFVFDGNGRAEAIRSSLVLQFLMGKGVALIVSYVTSHMFMWPGIYLNYRKSKTE